MHQSFRLTRDPDAPEVPSVGSPREAFLFAILQQAVLFLLAALLLDGGVVLRRRDHCQYWLCVSSSSC